MNFSIIIPVFNNLPYTIGAINTVFNHTKDFELIVVDNGSTDDTNAYLQTMALKHPNFKFASFPENQGFAAACNTGLEQATGDFVIFLNNDTLVTENWADQLVEAIPLAEDEWDASPIGLVGPVSNNAGGNQRIQADPYDIDQLQPAALDHHKTHAGHTRLAGFLSGAFLMITRPCLEDIGNFDPRFKIGGVEDTELCLRAQLKGWKCAIDYSTYVHHFGQQTIAQLTEPYVPVHRANQLAFIEKYYDDTPKKLIATFRVRNQPDLLKTSLDRAAQFADEIIVLCDRCTDHTPDVAKEADKVVQVLHVNEDWDLYRDRSLTMKAARAAGADWIIALDADELPEDSFTYEYAHQLMHPLDPNVLAYSFPFCTFFLGTTHYRTDGVFGDMRGLRMWRVLPNQHPRMVRHKHRSCLHCPSLAPFNVRNLRIRIKHYGYHTPQICRDKHTFYTHLDPDPDKAYIGPRGYDHLVDPSFSVNRWRQKNDLTLCMVVKDEEINLFGFLYKWHAFFDDIVIVDTGSSDHTPHIAQLFGARVFHFKWRDSFAAARNFAKSKCTTAWIFSPDPDEDFNLNDVPTLFKMLEANVHAWLFQMVNFQKDNTVFYSDNVRLLRNIPEVYWTHLSHENITEASTKHNLIVQPAPFRIKHYGYLKSPEDHDRKVRDYGRMLKKELRKHPQSAICHFHLAFHHFEANKEIRGLNSLQKALDLQPDLFIASKELGLRHLSKAQQFFQKTLETIPPNHYFYPWVEQVVSKIDQTLNTPVDRVPPPPPQL